MDDSSTDSTVEADNRRRARLHDAVIEAGR